MFVTSLIVLMRLENEGRKGTDRIRPDNLAAATCIFALKRSCNPLRRRRENDLNGACAKNKY